MANKCLYCGSEIPNHKKYCNESCKGKYRYAHFTQKKACKTCGKVFQGSAGTKYCSKECSLIAQRNTIKTCPICNKQFKARGNGIYCSKSCYRTANSPKKNLHITKCEVCGTSFRCDDNNTNEVCSDKCRSKLFTTYIDRLNQELFGTTSKEEIRRILKHE